MAVAKNKSIEVLNLRNNNIKHSSYVKFWEKMCDNTHLKKANLVIVGAGKATQKEENPMEV